MIETLLCTDCGALSEGVEGAPCDECESFGTVGCGPIDWTADYPDEEEADA